MKSFFQDKPKSSDNPTSSTQSCWRCRLSWVTPCGNNVTTQLDLVVLKKVHMAYLLLNKILIIVYLVIYSEAWSYMSTFFLINRTDDPRTHRKTLLIQTTIRFDHEITIWRWQLCKVNTTLLVKFSLFSAYDYGAQDLEKGSFQQSGTWSNQLPVDTRHP